MVSVVTTDPAESPAESPAGSAGLPPAPPRGTGGLALALAAGLAATAVGAAVPALSPLLVAVVLGAALGNTRGVTPRWRPGLAVASRRVLRVGVALLGLQLALDAAIGLGWPVLLAVVGVVAGGLASVLALGHALGVPPARRLLIACGSSICGAAAVAAVDDVTDSDEDDVAAALAVVVVLGSVAMLALPALAVLLDLPATSAGAWVGAGTHEVGQVVVAGGLLGGVALQVAVVVKLARVLMLAPVLAVVARRHGRTAGGARTPLVPLFVVGFVACVAARTVLPLPAGLLEAGSAVGTLALAAAMFALGTGVDVRALARTPRADVVLGAAAAVVVAVLALAAAFAVA